MAPRHLECVVVPMFHASFVAMATRERTTATCTNND
jgi:hypothetical protein